MVDTILTGCLIICAIFGTLSVVSIAVWGIWGIYKEIKGK